MLSSHWIMFSFRTWVRGGWLTLPNIIEDSIFLTMMLSLEIVIGLVCCLLIFHLQKKIICCGIFALVTQISDIWNIYLIKLISLLCHVIAFMQNNMEPPFRLILIDLLSSSPLFIAMFGVPSSITTSLEKQWFCPFYQSFDYYVSKLGLIDIYATTWGGALGIRGL